MEHPWTRRDCLALPLALATPAVAAPFMIHRIVAVGDLHGDFVAWRKILSAAKLADDEGHWVGGEAVLVQTGDVIDRGADGLKIIRDLMRLQHEAQRTDGQIIALVGNHEAMNITGDLRYVSEADFAAYTDGRSIQRREDVYISNRSAIESGYRQRDADMSAEAIKQAWFQATPLGSIEHQTAWAPSGSIGSWIIGNPAVALIGGTVFVHGGISPTYVHMPIEEINRQVRAALLSRTTDPQSIINDPEGPLWYRGLARPDADTQLSQLGAAASSSAPQEPSVKDLLHALLTAYRAKRIVIAHTPALAGIEILYDGRLIRIDTGISEVFRGKVSYLDIIDQNPVPHIVERSQ